MREAWLALLHYQAVGASWLSAVDDRSFFLHAHGRQSPDDEWRASWSAFSAPVLSSEHEAHAQCRFPARFALVRAELIDSGVAFQDVDCPGFAAYRERLGATSLSVVFVGHFLKNPASAFGHTMLYLGSGRPKGSELSDYSVSFEANTDGLSPAVYIPRGLFGGLTAGYRVAPLFERARKYEREEQRDLWMFPLRVSQQEIEQLVRHLWELKDIRFRYGFFGGNCAEKILAVLHAVAPGYGALPADDWAVLPAEVSRRLVTRIGLGGEPVHRLSLSNQYRQLVTRLPQDEKEQLDLMRESLTVPAGASSDLLDAALVWSEWRMPDRAFRQSADSTDHPSLTWRRALWSARVAQGRTGASTRVPGGLDGSLLRSHSPSSFTIGAGYGDNGDAFYRASLRWLLHTSVDPAPGYPPFSTIEAGRIDLELDHQGIPSIEEVALLRVERLPTPRDVGVGAAWRFEISGRRLEVGDKSPLHFGAEIGVGMGIGLQRDNYSVSTFVMVGARPGTVWENGDARAVTAAIGSAGLVFRLPADIRARFSGEYDASFHQMHSGQSTFATTLRKGLTPRMDMEVTTISSRRRRGVSVGAVLFY